MSAPPTAPPPALFTSAAPSAPAPAASSSSVGISSAPSSSSDGELECSICYEAQPATWGMLDCCQHPFCLACISAWQTDHAERQLQAVLTGTVTPDEARKSQSCPVCRREYDVVVPTPALIPAGPEKDEAVKAYRAGLAKIPCADLLKSPPDLPYCPRGRDCLYSHTLPSTSYRYTFRHTLTEHYRALDALADEREAQRFFLALLQSGGAGDLFGLALGLGGGVGAMVHRPGVRVIVEDLTELVRMGELGGFRSRMMRLGDPGEWMKQCVEGREWVGEAEEPEEDAEDWYTDDEEAEEADDGATVWQTDSEAELSDDEPPPLERIEDVAGGEDEDDLPPLEPLDGLDDDGEEDDLPALESIEVDFNPYPDGDDDLPPLEPLPGRGRLSSSLSGNGTPAFSPSRVTTFSRSRRPSLSSLSSSSSTASSSPDYPEADSLPLPPPRPRPSSETLLSRLAAWLSPPRPPSPGARDPTIPVSFSNFFGRTQTSHLARPAETARHALSYLRLFARGAFVVDPLDTLALELDRRYGFAPPLPTTELWDPAAEDAAAAASDAWVPTQVFYSTEPMQPGLPPRGRSAFWPGGGAGAEEDAYDADEDSEEDYDDDDEGEDGSSSSGSEEDAHRRQPPPHRGFFASSSFRRPPSTRPTPAATPSSSSSAPAPAPALDPPLDPPNRALERQRRKAAEAAERRQAEEKWEEMD
ncbi:hypothetical protein JCM8097_000737 [Rhodosporidiobolus ruineniae]